MDVLNRGFGGYNTEWITPVFEQCFAKQHEQQHVPTVRLLTIWLGANDAAFPGSSQHVPLPAFRANLAALVRMVAAPASPRYSPATRVVLLTPPPVNTHQWHWGDRDLATTRTYAEAVKDVARAEGVPALDVFAAFWEAAGEDEARLGELLSDGLHLNAKGYEIVFDLLVEAIKENFPEIHYENLDTVFTSSEKIDPANPGPLLRKDIFKHVSS
ncbi:SGNH hydrolase-type esterase domain-containing protein [Amylocystis lapponica]|nr:SGNH hydrolase-type esterase domain-containing protein [Amylocystis lapponica]